MNHFRSSSVNPARFVVLAAALLWAAPSVAAQDPPRDATVDASDAIAVAIEHLKERWGPEYGQFTIIPLRDEDRALPTVAEELAGAARTLGVEAVPDRPEYSCSVDLQAGLAQCVHAGGIPTLRVRGEVQQDEAVVQLGMVFLGDAGPRPIRDRTYVVGSSRLFTVTLALSPETGAWVVRDVDPGLRGMVVQEVGHPR